MAEAEKQAPVTRPSGHRQAETEKFSGSDGSQRQAGLKRCERETVNKKVFCPEGHSIVSFRVVVQLTHPFFSIRIVSGGAACILAG